MADSRQEKAEAYAHMCGALEKYRTTENACQCPDWQIRGVTRREIDACKHMLALRLRRGALESSGRGVPR